MAGELIEFVGEGGQTLMGLVLNLEQDNVGGTYRFRHSLTREAIYTDMIEPQRKELHMRAAGVRAALSRYDGVNHGFMFWVGIVDKAGKAMNESCDWLRAAFAQPRGAAPE